MTGYSFNGPLGDRELLTVSQTMAATGLGKTSVFELIKAGALERVRILSATRITRRSVERLIAAGLEKAEA
jgi:predicted DNA-binding transcriptional regulator AlpA